MKIILTCILLTLLLQCNGDVRESINQQLPLNSFARIPSPSQSLLPPTFDNPIKDYSVGLIPPPIDGHSLNDDARSKVQQHQVQLRNHIHSNPYTRATGFINTARPSVNLIQQQSGYSAVHQKTHHSPKLLQPQVYQPKTTIYQPFQQFTAHEQPHYPQPAIYGARIAQPPVAAVTQHQHQHQHHKHFVSTPQYHDPVTQNRVHQHSTHSHYVSIPVQRAPAVVQHTHPSVQKSAFAPRLVSSSGASIIQSYPSVSYTAIPQHGSTLNFGNAKLDPELVQIISEVFGRNH